MMFIVEAYNDKEYSAMARFEREGHKAKKTPCGALSSQSSFEEIW
ncbi:hypothetical protein PSE_4493 [Pseudovibrio sp. FO-BEG1]|nr:hypothetical protein PSE_4493 [Pseudovibrio sp. FO-BEG1]